MAADRLRTRGIPDASPQLALTEAGADLRDLIEAETSRLAMRPWLQIGEADTDELRRLATDLSWAVVDAGTFDPRSFALPRTP